MPELGYHLSSEEHGPNDLVDFAARAEEVGFDFAMISDHYHPWIREQGNSPFVWSVLGGIARATDDLPVGTGVTCPTVRIHPAVVAQAAATTAAMFDGQFRFGVGTGERLNEHILGDRWPPHHVRLEMLAEAVGVMRDLWTGEMVSHHGDHYTVENAQLFTLPEEPPPVLVSGYGPEASEAAGDFGDGFVSTSPEEKLVRAYEEGGGDGPTYGMFHVCVAEAEAEARRTAHRIWPNSALSGVGSELPTPVQFEQASKSVTEEDVAKVILTDQDPQAHVERVQQFEDAGFDHVWVHQVGPEQDRFFDFYESDVLPSVG